MKVPHSRRYRLTREGYSICVVFLKLFERVYAPLTAGLLQPVSRDSRLQRQKRSQLDRLYQQVTDERFKGDFSAFARMALDMLAGQLGYPVESL